jgi:hypothetical protein
MDLPISIGEAVRGASIKVPTFRNQAVRHGDLDKLRSVTNFTSMVEQNPGGKIHGAMESL